MSRVEVVDQAYRLQPQDLAGAPHKLIISNVSLQGLEEMVPILHFEGFGKRLALDPDHCRSLTELTGTPVFRNWVGAEVVLTPVGRAGGQAISISAPTKHRTTRSKLPSVDSERQAWLLSILVVAVLLALSFLYLVLNFDIVAATLRQLQFALN